jgi:acetyl esterase/lipase
VIAPLRRATATIAAALLVSAATVASALPVGARAGDGPRPGTVVSAESIAAPPGSQGWRVVHHSRRVDDRDVTVSGLVFAPDGPRPPGGRPVVAWAHGTTGLVDACAPSGWADPAGTVPWLEDLLAAGYVVVSTDYHGKGGPGLHPYLVGESEGRAVLDSVRAARRLPTGASRDVVVAGHSQGGHSALFAGEIAARYAPELRLLGVAPGAPVSDPGAFLTSADALPGTVGFLVMGALGYRVAYPELRDQPLLRPDLMARSDVARRECAGEVLTEYAGESIASATVDDPEVRAAWDERLVENTAGRRPAGAPVLVWQGDADPLTTDAVNATYLPRACAQGSVVDYRRYPGADHASVIAAARSDVLAFVRDRVAGAPPTNGCS